MTSEVNNIVSELDELGELLRAVLESLAVSLHGGIGGLDLLGNLHSSVEEISNLIEILLVEATRSEGGGAHADSTGGHGRNITRNGVLVSGDVGQLKNTLDLHRTQSKLKENKNKSCNTKNKKTQQNLL